MALAIATASIANSCVFGLYRLTNVDSTLRPSWLWRWSSPPAGSSPNRAHIQRRRRPVERDHRARNARHIHDLHRRERHHDLRRPQLQRMFRLVYVLQSERPYSSADHLRSRTMLAVSQQAYRQSGYSSGGSADGPTFRIVGLSVPFTNRVEGTVNFRNYPGRGSVIGVPWSATRR